MAATYIPITSITLSASAASVTFSGIPQTYTDIVIRYSARTTNASFVGLSPITINSISSGYSNTVLEGNGSTANSSRSSSAANWNYGAGVTNGAGATANTFSSNEMYIPNYANGAYKVAGSFGVTEGNVANGVYMEAVASLLQNTAAVSSVTISGGGYDFVAGSTFHLYGIKKD